MFELQTNRWEWRTVRVRAPKNGQPGPCPRLGHSFTLGLNKFAYVFGGLANDSDDPRHNVPRYLNDFYAINLSSSPYNLGWEAPMVLPFQSLININLFRLMDLLHHRVNLTALCILLRRPGRSNL